MPPWKDWYHCMGNTYGTWLPGDPRGFRMETHKHHVPYDYRQKPPPGLYDRLHRRAKELMTRPPVYLDAVEQRRRVLDEVVASLLRRDVQLAVAALDRVHLHVLLCCPDHNPRHWLGIAKKESSHYCQLTGHAPPSGGLWASKCECKPITGPGHYENALRYVADHANRGAMVYVAPSTNPLAEFDPNDLLVE
jgi:hypothetical protein